MNEQRRKDLGREESMGTKKESFRTKEGQNMVSMLSMLNLLSFIFLTPVLTVP